MDVAETVEVLGIVAGAVKHKVVAARLGGGKIHFSTRRRGRRRGGRLPVFGGALPTGLGDFGGTLDVFDS